MGGRPIVTVYVLSSGACRTTAKFPVKASFYARLSFITERCCPLLLETLAPCRALPAIRPKVACLLNISPYYANNTNVGQSVFVHCPPHRRHNVLIAETDYLGTAFQ